MDIASRIRTARKTAGLSQRALALKMGVSPSAVAQWETEVTTPKIVNRADLAKLLNIPFVQLLPEGPAAAATGDANAAALMKILEELPASVREAMLMQAAAIRESLAGEPARPTPPRKAPKQPKQTD